MNKFYSFIRGLIYLPFKLLYPVTVVGKNNIPLQSRIISVSNHLSWIDIPLLAVNVPGYRRFIAKKQIGKNKLIHKLAVKLGIIFIDRGKADMAAMRQSISALRSDEGISIFPEGTRNKTGDDLQEIKGGVTMLAIKGHSSVLPVMIARKSKVFRRNFMYVAPEFDLSEFDGVRMDVENTDKAAAKVASHMESAAEALEAFLALPKAQRKAQLKEQKRQYSQNKKEYKPTAKQVKAQRKAKAKQLKADNKAAKAEAKAAKKAGKAA